MRLQRDIGRNLQVAVAREGRRRTDGVEPDEQGFARLVADKRSDVAGALHRFLDAWSLRLLIGVEHLQILCRKPRKHLSELWFVGTMAEHQDVFRIDALPTQEVVQIHFAPAKYSTSSKARRSSCNLSRNGTNVTWPEQSTFGCQSNGVVA